MTTELRKWTDLFNLLDSPDNVVRSTFNLVHKVGKKVFPSNQKYQWFLVEVFVNNKDALELLWNHHLKQKNGKINV